MIELEHLRQRLIGRTIVAVHISDSDDISMVLSVVLDDGRTVMFEAMSPPPWDEPELDVRIVEPTPLEA